MRLRERLGTAFALIAIAALLSGCGGSSEESSNTSAAVRGGTLTFALAADPETLTPAESLNGQAQDIIAQIIEPLFEVNEAGDVKPLLAKSLSTSADGLTTTIALRSGIKFSDGKPMTASDVAFSINQARKSPYYGSVYEPIDSVSAASPDTVVIKTSKPDPAIEEGLSLWITGVVPADYGGMSGKDFSEHPIGTGPFKLKSWSHGESITLVRNANYWQPAEPLLNEVVFRITPSDSSRVVQLHGGQVDVVQAPPYPQVAGLEAQGFKKGSSPMNAVTGLLMNQKEPLFKDPHVRKAIDLALDRQGIANVAYSGFGEAAGSYLAPPARYFDKSLTPPKQNIKEAKTLVASAVREGLDPNFGLITFAGESTFVTFAQVVQQDLKEVGLNVTIEPLDSAAALQLLEEGKFDTTLGGGYSTLNDPTEFTTYLINYMLKPSGVNVQRLESLAARAAVEQQPSRRQKLYNEIQADVAQERDFISIAYNETLLIMAGNVSGLEQTAVAGINLRKAGFTG